MKFKFLIILLLGIVATTNTKAQSVAIKTNVLYDLTATANLGIEVGLAPKWTLDVSGNLNAWNIHQTKRWKHWLVQPEARYWFCDRFSRHFVGFHVLGGQYNIGGLKNNLSILGTNYKNLTDKRYQGWGVGAGAAYGYAMILGKHWNLEFELGVGYIYSGFDLFECAGCGRRVGQDSHHYLGLTKAAINLVYLF